MRVLDVGVGGKDASLQPEDGPQQHVSQSSSRPQVESLPGLIRHPVQPQHMSKVAALHSTPDCSSRTCMGTLVTSVAWTAAS